MATYINIRFFDDTDKTKVWEVTTKDDSATLGYIKWFGRWRCYAFFPEKNTVYERQCLRDITEFIEEEMRKRKRLPLHTTLLRQ